ncbi:MAG: ABC transporter permease subunit [Clostridiaceae bacterium]
MTRKDRRKIINNVSSSIFSKLVYAFIYLPVVILVVFSFNDQKANTHWVGFTTEWYVKLFHDSELLGTFGNTLIVAVVSTVLAVIIGTIGAVGLVRFNFKGKSVINNALYVPIVIPEIVLAVALLSIFSAISFPLGILTLILGHTTLTVPFVIITIKSRLSGFDQSVEEASMDLGASRRTTFLKVTLPMIMPGVMSGGFLAFTLSLDDLIISNFIAGTKCMTFPVKVYSMVKSGISPEVNALTTILIALFLAGLLVSKVLNRRRSLA